MDLTPGERAILNQLRHLQTSSATRVHPMTAVTSHWPALHYEAYRHSFSGLIGKKLVQPEANGQMVRLTAEGFEALGLAVPPPPAVAVRRAAPKAPPPAATPARSSWRFWRS